MNIRGLFKTSLVDYPGKVSAVVFTGGCNLSCGYCHNPDLALNSPDLQRLDDEGVISFLKRRSSLLDGVTVSGGEPAMDRGLVEFLQSVREIGLSVKVDTNGFFPEVISRCIEKGLVDYIALDIKTSPSKYPELTRRNVSFNSITATLEVLRESGIDYEARTTCVPGFASIDDIREIGEKTGRLKNYYLQQFVNTNPLLDSSIQLLPPYSAEHLLKLKAEAEKFSDNCALRGV